MNISILWLIVLMVECNCLTEQCLNVKADLSSVRKRRHLTFPEKSDIVLTMSLLKTFMTHAPSGWNIVFEVDVLYPLPDEKFTSKFFRRKLHHKQKREFWEQIRNALDLHNVDGHACVIRSICETRKYMAPPGKSLVHDILRAIFMAPLHDEEFVEEMKEYNELKNPNYCELPNDCPFSLIDLVLAMNKQ